MLLARGSTLQVAAGDDAVAIERKRRATTPGTKPAKSIPFGKLAAVLYREPRLLLQGYLHLVLVDGPEPRFDTYGFPTVTGRTIRFSRKATKDFERVRSHIEGRLRGSDPSLLQRLQQAQQAADRKARRTIRTALAIAGVLAAVMLAGAVASRMG